MTTPTTSRRRPTGRYDEPSRLGARIVAVVLSVLFIGLLAAIVAALYPRLTGQSVQARVIDFQVRSDRVVTIDVEVVKEEGGAAYCLLRARGADGAEVGREVVVVAEPGTPGRTVRLEHDLATTARAVTGEEAGCLPTPIPSSSLPSAPRP